MRMVLLASLWPRQKTEYWFQQHRPRFLQGAALRSGFAYDNDTTFVSIASVLSTIAT